MKSGKGIRMKPMEFLQKTVKIAFQRRKIEVLVTFYNLLNKTALLKN